MSDVCCHSFEGILYGRRVCRDRSFPVTSVDDLTPPVRGLRALLKSQARCPRCSQRDKHEMKMLQHHQVLHVQTKSAALRYLSLAVNLHPYQAYRHRHNYYYDEPSAEALHQSGNDHVACGQDRKGKRRGG